MKKIFILSVLIGLSFSDKSGLFISEFIHFPMEASKKEKLIRSLENLLENKEGNLAASGMVDWKHYEQYNDIFDILKKIEHSKKFQDSTFFKSQLINVVEQPNKSYRVTLAWTGVDTFGHSIPRLIFELGAIEQKDHFQFYCLFEENTAPWNQVRINNVTFYYKNEFNQTIAQSFDAHNSKMAELLEMDPLKMSYYKCRDLQEAYRLFGIHYLADINGTKRGCITINKNNIFVSGTNSEEYNHDLTHYYFAKAVPKEKKNWTAEEGFNVNLTDYWAESTETNYALLKKYLLDNPDLTPLEIFTKNRILKRPIPTKMPVAGIIMRKIKREHGMKAVMQLISCGPTDEDFFRMLDKITNINKNNFNLVVRQELGLE